jgi:hypothetical protein
MVSKSCLKKDKAMSKILLIFLLNCPYLAYTQTDLAVKHIPDSILKGADAVKRYEQTIFKVESLSKTVEYNKVAYTILNSNADNLAILQKQYDKMHEINTFNATLYDATGKKIRSVKRSEVKDESAVSSISIMEDSREKSFGFFYKDYPYTIEFETEVESKNTMFFTNWCPLAMPRLGVQQSSFVVECPQDYDLRFKLLSGVKEPVTTQTGNKKMYSWEVKNLKPLRREPYSSSWYSIVPTVITTPQKFVVEGYAGDMSSWESFGDFNKALNAGRDKLPDDIKEAVKKIVVPLSTDNEKIAALYKYLQQNTRYVSVQLGIGGWQSFEASYVAKNKFGDCKALSNYMVALLKEAGITAYYSVIKAGSEPNYRWFLPEFTNNYFNHIIVCVPNRGDTIWLECTDQYQYPGYMGDFTDNRYALLVTPEGGKLVKTPKYGLEENIQVRKINADLTSEGDLKIRANTMYQAQQQDQLQTILTRYPKEKLMEILKSGLDIPTYEIDKYEYKPIAGKLPVLEEYLEITAINYAQISGKRVFISPNIMGRSNFRPTADSQRLNPIRVDFESRDVDTAIINIPTGYAPENAIKDVVLKSAFGKYHAAVKLDGDKLIYTRTMEKYSGIFPASEYAEMVRFYEAVFKADRVKLVLVKRE